MPAPHWVCTTHKGGVGKTLEVVLIAAAAAELGRRVLVLDMDPQANATRRLAVQLPDDPDERARTSLARVLVQPARGAVRAVLRPCGWGGTYSALIDVAPGHLEMELLPADVGQGAGSERRLLTALAGVADDYDLVLIDCPPGLLGPLIDNAWTAADLLLVPVEGEYDSIQAARRVVQRTEKDRVELNPDLAVGGFLVNRYRTSLSLHTARISELDSILGPDFVCPIRLPELMLFKNTAELTKPLMAFGSEGRSMAVIIQDIVRWMDTRAKTLMPGSI